MNVQHPGDSAPAEDPTATSTWPDGRGAGRPRPATVAVRRVDGGIVGASVSAQVEELPATGSGLTAPLTIGAVTAVAAGGALVRFRNRVIQDLDR